MKIFTCLEKDWVSKCMCIQYKILVYKKPVRQPQNHRYILFKESYYLA